MGSGSSRYLQFIKEVTKGTTPVTPAMKRLRNTGGSGIENARTNVTSGEIRSDRSIITSRLGNNQPNVNVPFEFSYESYEEFMQGALGGEWIGATNLTGITVDIVASGSTVTTDDASSWLTKGVTAGSYIVISDAVAVGNNEAFYVYAVGGANKSELTLREMDKTTPAVLTDATDDVVNIKGGYEGKVIDASANNLTVSSTNKTITAASSVWVTAEIRVGDKLYIEGFVNAANNGWHKVTGVTATVITFSGSTLVNETLSVGNANVVLGSARLLCGTILDAFTIEEGMEDISEYVNVKGAQISSWNMSIQPDAVITGGFALQGVSYSNFSAASIEASHINSNTNEVYDSYTGSLTIPGVGDCIVTGIDFTLDNGLNRRYALMQKNACSIGEGRTNLTGTINAYFPDSTLVDIYDGETILSIELRIVDLDGNAYILGFPKVKFTSDSRSTTENDITESIGFQALGGNAKSTMFIIKQPA